MSKKGLHSGGGHL